MSRPISRLSRLAGAAVLAILAGPAWAETDPLALESAPEASTKAASPWRAYLEGAAGRASQRYGLGSESVNRVSLDLSGVIKSASGWRFGLSNRLDHLQPEQGDFSATVNSLREAYVGWQDEQARWAFDAGRVNLRLGPAYGYNPTDFFREGILRVVTSVDPLAVRDNRMGTVMLRGQRLWEGGSASIALAPELRRERSTETFSLDLGATNRSDRVLAMLSAQLHPAVSTQVMAFHERGVGSQAGLNATALLSDQLVGFVELTGGRSRELLGGGVRSAKRGSIGATYTTAFDLALTVEAQHNGFAAPNAVFRDAGPGGLPLLADYLARAQDRQDSASRRALFVYAAQRGLFTKKLDATAFVRWNSDDDSRLVWAELRYHWDRIDLALQAQRASGGPLTEYGSLVTRQLAQIVATFYF